VRILTEGTQTADWPLSRKFGCQADMAMDLLILARDLGLEPYGVSFHVGSQQRDIGTWDAAIAKVKVIFERLGEENGIHLKMINMGGGFPANYIARTNEMKTYAEEITRFLDEDFSGELPEIILEPGRSLIANAGVLVSEVVLISRKSHTALDRWVYTDVGKFSGLIETLDEAIKFPIYTEKKGEMEEVVIAGPTCDSADIMYENYKYGLPLNLAIGDRLYWFTTGAYTSSYSAIEFNGFPPLKTYFI
jgi:ornithine decarboxylase